MKCGGASDQKEADAEIQSLVDEVKDELLGKLGRNGFDTYKALTYRSQLVAGTNYFVKVQVSPDECIHVRLFEPLPCNKEDPNRRVSLTSQQAGKTVEEEVAYF